MDIKIGEVRIARDDTRALERIADTIAREKWDLCVGIGGGRILDIAKFASFLNRVPFISFPTLLSHDGIASPVAVIRDGKHWSESRVAESPCAVIIDLETVARAPETSLLSGVSDLTANLFASLDSELRGPKPAGEYDSLAAAIGRSASQLVFPGFQGLSIETLTTEQAKQLAWGLVLSGIAMSICGSSRPASGAEHKISHAVDYLFPVSVSHGFTVSVGNVVSAFLHEQYREEIIAFNSSLGLPVTGDDIGIGKKDFAEAILYASRIRPDRYTILEEKKLTRKEIHRLLDEIKSANAASGREKQ
jgi:glycerol-1-phosphate dehydrogenase [NAD(P)+]